MTRAAEVRSAGGLVGDALGGVVGMVRDVHRAIAGRSFAAVGPLGWPARVLHHAIAGAIYETVRISHATLPRAGFAIAARAIPADAQPLSSTPGGALVLAAINGLWGDRISARHPALAVSMAVRSGGHDVPLTPDGLRAAYPGATPRLAVFVHGLAETERWWWRSTRRQDGQAHPTYGSRLRHDLGYTPVYVRYNTGLRVSDNGQRLADIMAELVEAWPTGVDEIVFVGHSMGGLVVRSACHYGDTRADQWTGAVRHVCCLGAPNLGAPLEKGLNAAAHLLARLPETKPAADLLNLRSVGVKDLRYGSLVEDDWRDHDPDEFLTDRCTEVPFLKHVTYHFLAATVTATPGHPVGTLVGDLLVRYPSAAGQGRRRRVPFIAEHGRHVGGLHHFDLLNHPAVYHQIRTWLAADAATAPPGRQ